MPYPVTDPLAEAAVQQIDGAVTMARHVFLPWGSIDAQIVAANQEAASLFGFAHPRELQGQLVSHVHHPDDALRTRLYALARLLRGTTQYATYPMRILRGPHKVPFWVYKRVHQVAMGGVMTWVTTNTALDQQQTYVMPPVEDVASLLRDYTLQFVTPSHIASQLFADLLESAPDSAPRSPDDSIGHALAMQAPDLSSHARPSTPYFSPTVQERRARVEAAMERYRTSGPTDIWIRRGTMALQIPLAVLRTRYDQASAQHKLLCVRCLHTWEPIIPNPVLCPKCQQDWGEFYVRRPYGSRQPAASGPPAKL